MEACKTSSHKEMALAVRDLADWDWLSDVSSDALRARSELSPRSGFGAVFYVARIERFEEPLEAVGWVCRELLPVLWRLLYAGLWRGAIPEMLQTLSANDGRK